MRKTDLLMRLVACLFALASLSACATVQPHTTATPEGRAIINERAEGKTATLVFQDGRSVRARALRISNDSLSWIDPESGSVRDATTAEVAEVAFPRPRHVLRNAIIGLVIGAGTGYLLGYSNPEFPFNAHQMGTLAAVGLGGLGAGIGVLTGIDHSNRDVYPVVSPDE